jgi:hypothetical protein
MGAIPRRHAYRQAVPFAALAALCAIHQPLAARPPPEDPVSTGKGGVECGIDPYSARISGGDQVTFRGRFRGRGTKGRYVWEFPGGEPASVEATLNPPAVSYGRPGRYRATLRVLYEGDGEAACVVEAIVTVEP